MSVPEPPTAPVAGTDATLGYLSALELSGRIMEVLGQYAEDEKAGKAGGLDTPALTIASTTPVVLGQRGKVIVHGQRRGDAHTVMFTVRQVTEMGEFLADVLPGLAAKAFAERTSPVANS